MSFTLAWRAALILKLFSTHDVDIVFCMQLLCLFWINKIYLHNMFLLFVVLNQVMSARCIFVLEVLLVLICNKVRTAHSCQTGIESSTVKLLLIKLSAVTVAHFYTNYSIDCVMYVKSAGTVLEESYEKYSKFLKSVNWITKSVILYAWIFLVFQLSKSLKLSASHSVK